MVVLLCLQWHWHPSLIVQHFFFFFFGNEETSFNSKTKEEQRVQGLPCYNTTPICPSLSAPKDPQVGLDTK